MPQVAVETGKRSRVNKSKAPNKTKGKGKKAKAAPTKAERQDAALARVVGVAERVADSIFDGKIELGRAILAADAEGVTRARQMRAIKDSPRFDHIREVMSLSNAPALSKLATIASELGGDATLQRLVGDVGLSNDDAHALASRMGKGLIRYGTVVRKLSGEGSDSEKKAWIKHVIDSGKMPAKTTSGRVSSLKVSPEVKARAIKLAKGNGVSVDELILDALKLVEANLE